MTRGPAAFGHDARVFLTALASGSPAVAVSLVLLWTGEHPLKVRLTLTVAIAIAWLALSLSVRDQVVRPLQTIANLLAALREGDFSIRGGRRNAGEALGTALEEINAIGQTLRDQRLGAIEASALLAKVMAEIDVAIFAFDRERRLRLVNRAGEQLLGRPPGRLIGESAESLRMSALLEGDPVRTLDSAFAGGSGRYDLRRSSFRQHGLPHELIVLTDVKRALREEERQAWQRLSRVLGHEINNSLAPIHSIAGNLRQTIRRESRPADWETDAARGLEVIERRAEALGRFTAAYARLAKLPPPRFAPVDAEAWIRRVAELDQRARVTVDSGPALSVWGDSDQLDQLLINLVRNAIDAALETGGGVSLAWTRSGRDIEVIVADEGPGIAEASNLFVPFFTTKPHGSGIGLVLSRQIAEAHRGSLELRDRDDPHGCRAVLRLPLSQQP
jgi:nitrogen fixation/metabolism regulation signal transduction histidine kinase